MSKEHIIYKVTPGSIAEEMKIEAGDVLVSVNGKEIEDVFDFHYAVNDEYLEIVIRKADGEEWEIEIEKEYNEDLGIEFENGLMDDYKSCTNKCIFCFIDQMPPGMRETLYFKDDDSRLSFLQGNYITLTNMKDKDLDRIIQYHMGPINISVQTTNPELRCMMLHNRFAGDSLKKIDRLYEAGIPMNGQIVLCKGVNDGEELERSICDLMKYCPCMESVSVVPVGLSKYRDGLYPLEPFTKEDAIAVIDMIEKWQKKCLEEHDLHFIHASDEWYMLAERPLPEEDSYDGYLQLENGVGMMRLLINEFAEAMEDALAEPEYKEELMKILKEDFGGHHKVTLITGRLAAPFLRQMASDFMKEFPGYEVEVLDIRNDFFGERITVSGLITAQDLIAQAKERNLGNSVAIPCNMLRSGERVFLDDQTVEDVESALQVPVIIVKSSGLALFEAMLGYEVEVEDE